MRTYDVVPVSGALGLVEFVPGTLPLREAIAAQLEPQARAVPAANTPMQNPSCVE